jgi:hypothetical protein
MSAVTPKSSANMDSNLKKEWVAEI